ncbi:hypothetical protein KBI23_17210 [bacterium]|nr:hypothetical protein [bacterium]MBP9808696.1 hypothetical protein [bacterium]
MLQTSSDLPEQSTAVISTDNQTDNQISEPVNKMWLAVVAGLLIATSNTWLFHPQIKQSSYSAPWVYPGYEPLPETHTI